MEIVYRITRQDFVRAYKTHAWWCGGLLQALGVLVLGVVAIYCLLHRTVDVPNILFAAWGVFLIIGPTAQIRRAYLKDRRLHQEFRAEINDSGMNIRGADASGELSWHAFTKFKEGPDFLMLYQGPYLFYIFPRAAFTPDQFQQFRALVGQHVPTATRRFGAREWILLAVVLVAFVLLMVVILKNT